MDPNTEQFYYQDFSAEQKLLKAIRAKLCNNKEYIDIPSRLNFTFDPQISTVYVSLFQPGIKHIRWGSKKKTLVESIDRVVEKLLANDAFNDFATHDPALCRILFEIVTDECSCDPKQLTTITLDENRLEPGIHGLKFRYQNTTYYYMPTDAITHNLMSVKQVFNYLAKRTGAAQETNRISERVKTMRSRISDCKLIKSFAVISYRDDALPLYRGYPVPVQLNKEIVRECINRSTDWILDNMKPNGQFLYYYEGIEDTEVDFQHPMMTDPTYYNILRHSGGTITLLRAFELTGQKKYLKGARKSIDFFLTTLREHEYQGHYACYPFFNSKSKLGGAGIGLVALTHYYRLSGDDRYEKYIKGLVYHILSRVSDTGEMIGYYIHPLYCNGEEILNPDEELKTKLFSFYYPGEALVGLALYLHHVKGIGQELRKLIMEKSKQALDFLIHERPKKYDYMFEPLPADGWLMQAIEEWVKIEGFNDQAYINFVFNDAQAMIDHMYKEKDAPYFDYIGSFYYQYGEHAYPDGARCEGLAAAYYLARYLGDDYRASYLMKHMEKSVKNLLYTYNTPQSCYAHKKPEKSQNSFRFKLTRQWVRVDSVQHSACFFARLLPELSPSLTAVS